MWSEEYEKLSNYEQKYFAEICNYLLNKNYVLRQVFKPSEKVSVRNDYYRFIETHIDLFREYLEVSNWTLRRYSEEGVFQVQNVENKNHLKLNKLSTFILYTLRLIYMEEREKLSFSNDVMTTIGSIVEKMKFIGLIDDKTKISESGLKEAIRAFRNFNIIEKLDGDAYDSETNIIIYPTILFIIKVDTINDIYNELNLVGVEEANEYEDEEVAVSFEESESMEE